MQIKDLIRLLKTHDENEVIKCLAIVEDDSYVLKIEGVGTVEDDKVIYIYAKEE